MQNDRPDLLRDRRLELGLPPTPPPLRPARGLVLLSNGVPELDQLMTTPASDLEGCQREVRAWLTAWQQRSPSLAELGWWLSVALDQADLWRVLVDEGHGECLLHQDLPPFEQAIDSDPSNSLEALEHLALFGSLNGEAVA